MAKQKQTTELAVKLESVKSVAVKGSTPTMSEIDAMDMAAWLKEQRKKRREYLARISNGRQ